MNKYIWLLIGFVIGIVICFTIISLALHNVINNNVCFDSKTAEDLILYWFNDGNYTMRYLK